VSFLVFLRPVRAEMPLEPTDEESRVVAAHYDYLVSLRDAGKLIVAGPSVVPDDTIGIGVLDVDDRAEVEALVAEDPAVSSGVMTAEIRPLRIAVRPSTRLPLEVFIVVRRADEFLVVHRVPQGGGYWHGISGAVERGETIAAAAERELREETGLSGEVASLGEPFVYLDITVHTFIVDVPPGWEPALNEEHDDYRWCTQDEAVELLYWPEPKEVLRTISGT
jgi:8-oxo-dGTP pyrophosphatase MutT (NUDIX family)